MKFSFFESVKGKVKGVLCTWERFCNAIDSPCAGLTVFASVSKSRHSGSSCGYPATRPRRKFLLLSRSSTAFAAFLKLYFRANSVKVPVSMRPITRERP